MLEHFWKMLEDDSRKMLIKKIGPKNVEHFVKCWLKINTDVEEKNFVTFFKNVGKFLI
jgi:hypothetical protein